MLPQQFTKYNISCNVEMCSNCVQTFYFEPFTSDEK